MPFETSSAGEFIKAIDNHNCLNKDIKITLDDPVRRIRHCKCSCGSEFNLKCLSVEEKLSTLNFF